MTTDDLSSAVTRVLATKAASAPTLRGWMRDPANLEEVKAQRAKEPPVEWTVIAEAIGDLGILNANKEKPNWRAVRQAYNEIAKPRRKPVSRGAEPRVGRPPRHSSDIFSPKPKDG